MEMRKQKCACCGKETTDVEPCFIRPDAWVVLPDHEKITRSRGSDDLQIIDDRFYIRTLLPMPVIGENKKFSVGIWVEVAFEDFKFYLKNYNEDNFNEFEGTLANTMPNYPESTLLKVTVRLRGKEDRPEVFVQDIDHPLAKMQATGVHQHDLLEFFAPRYQ